MKQRIITAIVLIGVLIPIFYFKMATDHAFNNYPIYIIGIVLTIIATSEMIALKESNKVLPFGMRLLTYGAVLYISFNSIFESLLDYELNLDILPLLVILLAIGLVIKRNFTINDASYLLFVIYYIGLTFYSLIHFFTTDIYVLLYIIFIAIATDSFAYFTGVFFGKHKVAPIISPKKTIEGCAGGSIIATILVSIYAMNTIMDDKNLFYIVLMTFSLTIIAQYGDLIASSLKRHFKVKDYGNLFPGHGGVLDRLDSVLFTSFVYLYLVELIELFL